MRKLFERNFFVMFLASISIFSLLQCSKDGDTEKIKPGEETNLLDEFCNKLGEDSASCKEYARKLFKEANIKPAEQKVLIENLSNLEEFEKKRDKGEISAAIIMVAEALLGGKSSTERTCDKLEKQNRLKENFSSAACGEKLKKACDKGDRFNVSGCAFSVGFCTEFFLGNISQTCKSTTEELFGSLIITKEKDLCLKAEKKQKLKTDVNACESSLSGAQCDRNSIFAIGSCLEKATWCKSFFLKDVGAECLKAAQNNISVNIETPAHESCKLAQKQGKLVGEKNIDACASDMHKHCDKKDFFPLDNCLNNSKFCSSFHFKNVGVECLKAAQNNISLNIETPAHESCKLAQKQGKLVSETGINACASEMQQYCGKEDFFKINNCLKDSKFCSSLVLQSVDLTCLAITRSHMDLKITTPADETCGKAHKKGWLKTGISTESCAANLQADCQKNDDLSPINVCLNSGFCSDFFFKLVPAACMAAVQKSINIPHS